LTYREISKEVGCSLGTISYHLGEGRKERISKKYKKEYIPKEKEINSIPDNYYSRKERMLKYRYGITLNVYDEMYKNQSGKCAICKVEGIKYSKKGLLVDHNHKTNEVRGLLCSSCNTGIGLLKDSIEVMTAGLEYLNNNGYKN